MAFRRQVADSHRVRAMLTLWIATSVALVLGLVGCASEVDDATPGFSGPWAIELQQAYENVSSPVAKAILADGVITDEEMEEVRAAQKECLENLGCVVLELNPDGSANIRPPQEDGESFEVLTQRTGELQQQCEVQTSWSTIGWLYTQMTRNPENQDIADLMVECLVRVGLESEGYTAEQYMSDLENAHFIPYLENQETPEGQKFRACNFDPLHAQ
ncbi:MAG: hypothetical protein LBN10_11125 [Propionibacteriaceae bacterium]|jgi:hypothetical protein|nr:hypothetical protein [Propionibacteriaceae bacterium]